MRKPHSSIRSICDYFPDMASNWFLGMGLKFFAIPNCRCLVNKAAVLMQRPSMMVVHVIQSLWIALSVPPIGHTWKPNVENWHLYKCQNKLMVQMQGQQTPMPYQPMGPSVSPSHTNTHTHILFVRPFWWNGYNSLHMAWQTFISQLAGLGPCSCWVSATTIIIIKQQHGYY